MSLISTKPFNAKCTVNLPVKEPGCKRSATVLSRPSGPMIYSTLAVDW